MYFCECCFSIIPFAINISTCDSLTENLQQKHFATQKGLLMQFTCTGKHLTGTLTKSGGPDEI